MSIWISIIPGSYRNISKYWKNPAPYKAVSLTADLTGCSSSNRPYIKALTTAGRITIDPKSAASLATFIGSLETFIWPDEEQPVKSAVRETALYGAGFFPIFRDVAIAAWNYADPDTQFFGYRASPAAGALEAIAKLPGAAIDIATGEGTKGDV